MTEKHIPVKSQEGPETLVPVIYDQAKMAEQRGGRINIPLYQTPEDSYGAPAHSAEQRVNDYASAEPPADRAETPQSGRHSGKLAAAAVGIALLVGGVMEKGDNQNTHKLHLKNNAAAKDSPYSEEMDIPGQDKPAGLK